jgi:lysophospholipase L1-like esterase
MQRHNDTQSNPARVWRRRWFAPSLTAALLLAATTDAVVCAQTQTLTKTHATTRPVPREGGWKQMHEAFLKRAKQGDVDLIFLGDSITQGWDGLNAEGQGPRQVWDRYYGPRKAANFGIGGDRTEHVLWRLDHGEVDGIKPKVVVLMIGTNNIHADTPAEIADGITAIIERLRSKLPDTRILLLGIFPRSQKPDATRDRVNAVNARIARLDDGKYVDYLDIGRHFLNEDGTIPQDVMPDFLHLTRKGYTIWADAIEPTLWRMLAEK